MGAPTNTWSVSGSVPGRLFIFVAVQRLITKNRRRTFAGGWGVKARLEWEKDGGREGWREREVCWKREWKGVAYAAATITWRIQRSLILPLCTCKRCVKSGGRVKCTRKVPIFEGRTPCLITPDMDGRKPTLWLLYGGFLMVSSWWVDVSLFLLLRW